MSFWRRYGDREAHLEHPGHAVRSKDLGQVRVDDDDIIEARLLESRHIVVSDPD